MSSRPPLRIALIAASCAAWLSLTAVAGAAEPTARLFRSGLGANAQPASIVSGPGGRLWFTDFARAIGQITVRGAISESSAGLPANANPASITSGADGNLWFVDIGANALGRVTPAGAVREFRAGLTGTPTDVARGPDGNVWFTEVSPGAVGRITPAGAIREF